MIGDTQDAVKRLKDPLPAGWFPDPDDPSRPSVEPVLDGTLTGIGSCFSWLYSLASYANLQTRLATATDVFLDIAAMDYFGGRIFRKPGQPDAAFSTKIRKEIVRERVTRRGLRQVLIDLTGRTPIIFEPALTTDTGGYGFQGMTQGSGLEYGGASVAGAGGYGSLQLGFQFFVTAFRATGGGIPSVAGYYTGSGWAGGGYGFGAIEYGTLAMSQGQITDTDINNAIVSVLPAATTAWTRITN